MKLQEQILRVFELTAQSNKPIYGYLARLVSEVGALSEAVEVSQGHSKKALTEPLVAEIADVIQCAISVLVKATPHLTDEARLNHLVNQFELKNDKLAVSVGARLPFQPNTLAVEDIKAAVKEVAQPAVWPFNPIKAEAIKADATARQQVLAQALGLKPITEIPAGSHLVNHRPDDPIAKRVIRAISEQLGLNEREVLMHQSFIADLGADSLDCIELVMAIEDEFGMEIPDEEAEQLLTVQHAVEYVKRRTQAGHVIPTPHTPPPETGRLYVNIRKHPNGTPQPTGKRKVTRFEVNGTVVTVGIGDGTKGWVLHTNVPEPGFLDFIVDSDKGKKVPLVEAIRYWQRHNP